MKYKKRPVVVEADQWFPDKQINGVVVLDNEVFIETLEGKMKVNPGDFIITGVVGEKYPCRHDIFIRTYEEVSDDIDNNNDKFRKILSELLELSKSQYNYSDGDPTILDENYVRRKEEIWRRAEQLLKG